MEETKIPLFMMLVGLPGSGKSTWAKQWIDTMVICSSDRIREELFESAGDEVNNKQNNELVFNTLHQRVKDNLISGNDVIYDATNINRKRRMQFLQEIKNIKCRKSCIVIATPIYKCRDNNQKRERKVPDEVIGKMYFQWETPYYFEGWNKIHIIYPFQDECKMNEIFDEILYLSKYDQKNHHHTKTLGKHLFDVGIDLPPNICDAGFLHDVAKPNCCTFINKNGEKNEDAHYYDHENAGAYEALFFKPTSGLSDILRTSVLINLHMKPYSWIEEKTKEKYKKLWGDELFDMVMKLHEADKNNH